MLSALVTLVVVLALVAALAACIAFVWSRDGRWSSGGTGVLERWELTGSAEDVLARRLQTAIVTIDCSVIESLDRPDLRWRLNEAAGLIRDQLLACSRLPGPSRPAVLREVEAMVIEFEGVCARLLLDAAQASSSVVRDRLRSIEESVEVLREARTEIDRLGA